MGKSGFNITASTPSIVEEVVKENSSLVSVEGGIDKKELIMF